MLNCDDCYICYRWWLKQNDMRPNVKVKVAQPNLEHRRQPLQCNAHYNLSLISFILVWPLWVRIPESLPTKVVNCVVLCIVCVDCVVLCIVCVQMCTVLLPPSVNPIAVIKYIISYIKAPGRITKSSEGSEQIKIINSLNPELNPICYLLVLLGAHHFLHVSRIRVKLLTFRLLMSYIYIWSTHSWCF